MVGQTIGQYRIVAKLGEGGMGAVYKGVDLLVEREVAIKMLRPEIARQPELVERFRSEAVALAKLNNPAIATLYNFFREADDFFMVMEFVAGRTLDTVIRESGAMPWERAVPIFIRILEGVQAAHSAGILHRDIKPSNIMLTNWGGVKVMDFGIARVLGTARLTGASRIVGTIEYLSPERIQGDEADNRTDIYSLGVVLYEMLSGRLPFEHPSDFEIMRRHLQDVPPPFAQFAPDVPEALEKVVMRALAKSPFDRYRNCSEFISALHTFDHAAESPANAPSGEVIRPTVFLGALPVKPTQTDSTAPRSQPQEPAGAPPVRTDAGLLSKLNWKHYAAAGGVAALLALGSLLAFHRTPEARPPAAAKQVEAPSKLPAANPPAVNNPPKAEAAAAEEAARAREAARKRQESLDALSQ